MLRILGANYTSEVIFMLAIYLLWMVLVGLLLGRGFWLAWRYAKAHESFAGGFKPFFVIGVVICLAAWILAIVSIVTLPVATGISFFGLAITWLAAFHLEKDELEDNRKL